MGNFYVSICVSDLTQAQLGQWLEPQPFPSYFGPAENNWICLVSKPLDEQDQRVIDAFGFALTSSAQRKAVAILNHDDDILSIDVYEDGKHTGSYNSCPGYFDPDPLPDDLKPRIESPEAFARMKSGVTTDQIVQTLTNSKDGDPWDIHSAVIETLGLPEYSAGMGFNYVERGESSAEWTFVSGTNGTGSNNPS